jgi:hypothetical protein
MTMSIERTVGVSDVPDVLDRIPEKGIVMDAWMRASVVSIDLRTVDTASSLRPWIPIRATAAP